MNELDPREPTPVSELSKEFQDTLVRPNTWGERQDINWKARFNVWPGQDASGRKLKSRLGKEPFPWDEASDAAVPLVDTYINEDVDTLMAALDAARILAVPVESNDAARANTVTNFVRWMFNQMPELDHEAELLANYQLERGCGVLAVFWKREVQLAEQEITVDQLRPEFAAAVADPLREDEAVEIASDVLDINKTDARKLVVDLRDKGAGKYVKPYICEDRPRFMALCPGEDFFASADTTDLQNARVLFYREFLTRANLEDGNRSYGWDKEWIKIVGKTCEGKVSAFSYNAYSYNTKHNYATSEKGGFSGLDTTKLFEVVHAFEKKPGPNGVPGIFYTVFTPHQMADIGGKELFAFRELLDYQHGRQPFVSFPRERINRRMDSPRGYGEIAYTMQNQVKTEWDSRADRASIATIPPLMHPVGRAPSRWGPAVRVPYVRPGECSFADIPKYDPGSKEVELSVRAMADQYFGRLVEGRDPNYSRMRRQRLVTRWLKSWREAVQMMFALCQQFMPDDFWFRVVGSAKAQPLRATRQEIQGKFDISLTFNVLNQEPDLLEAKLDLLLKLLQADVNAVVDRTELMSVIFEYLDPNLGERLLQPEENASLREIEDEKTVFSRMMGGQEENVKEQGQAYQLRMRVMKQLLETNPLAQQAYQGNERVRAVMDKRMKQLNFQIQQKTVNPTIGRLGA